MAMEIFRNKVVRATLIGGGAGLFFAFFAAIPVVYFSRPTFHAWGAAWLVIVLSLVAGKMGGCLAAVLKKDFRAAAVFGIAAAALCCGILFGFGWDPARLLDERSLVSAYRSRFPYGRPSLAREEDIVFIDDLVADYTRTRADMRAVRADLEWLKEKCRDDARRILDTQQTLERIETIKAKGLKSAVSSRSRFRLPRHHKTPVIIR